MTGGVSALPMQIRLENKRVDGDGGHIATRILSWAHGGPPCEGHNPAHGVTKPKARVCGRVRRQLGRYVGLRSCCRRQESECGRG